MKDIKGITYKDGIMVIDPNVDEANSDWIRAARLKRSSDPEDKKKLEDMENTPMQETE